MKRFGRITAVLALAALTALPVFAARGQADFTTYVALGTSLGAGFESNSLNVNHQQFSYPAIIAQQVGLPLCTVTSGAAEHCFAQPLVSAPGIGPELQLLSVTGSIAPAAGQGSPLMTGFGRPYNNLSIVGATALDQTTLKGTDPATGTAKAFAQFTLRGLGTAVDQAISLHPTFITVEVGVNEVLGAVLAGTPSQLFPIDAFKTALNSMLDKLIAGAPNAGIVMSNMPTNAGSLPFINTIPPVLVDSTTRQPILVNGAPFFFIADLGGGTIGQLPPGSKVTLTAQSDIQQGFGLPKVPPFSALPHAGEPLPDRDVLTPTEIAQIVTRANEINDAITAAAAARNIPVADLKGLFDRVSSGTNFIGPINITNAFVTGGFFSLDGFHFTDIGYTLFANEFIKAINTGYGTKIPLASITRFLQNNDPSQVTGASVEPTLTPEASRAILSIMPSLPSAPRRRATNY